MYFLTVEMDNVPVIRRAEFQDYADAVAACFEYCKSKTNRSVLGFHTEAINGRFARSYAQLDAPGRISTDDAIGRDRYAAAVKASNSFAYDGQLFFLIESDFGIEDQQRFDYDED